MICRSWEISVFDNIHYCIMMCMITCFVNIKRDLQVNPQPWSCICDICLFMFMVTHGLTITINPSALTVHID